jgi:hypothetical protein
MITCVRCNTENLEGSQYCDECGALLAPGGTARAKQPITEPTGEAPSLEAAPAALEAMGNVTESSSRMSGQVALAADVSSAAAAVTSMSREDDAPTHDADNNNQHASSAFTSATSFDSTSRAAAAHNNGPHAKLVIHRGRSVGKEFPLSEDEAHIGRWDADGGIFPDVDLDADDPEAKVSRRHARIVLRGGNYFIEDLGSTNGTFINRGRRLLPGDRQPLRDGDEVIVGKTFLRFHVAK